MRNTKLNLPTLEKSSIFGTHISIIWTILALLTLAFIGYITHSAMLVPPIAASAMYIFGAPTIPGTQPRSVLLGHVMAALVGFALLYIFGTGEWVAALATGLAAFIMNATKLFHIPAVATAALVVLLHPALSFIYTLGVASTVLAVLGWTASKTTKTIQYPLYW